MLTQFLALISETPQVSLSETTQISAALQKQTTRDFAPIWNIQATVDAFQSLDDVPFGYWPIIIRDDIGIPGAAGIHQDKNGQPFALVQASAATALTCSHECLEMLADPFGNRMVVSESLMAGQGRVSYLVEVCDPSEDEAFGYMVNGIRLSDFYTPQYFDPVTSVAVRYSFTGAIRAPRQVLNNGYVSWQVPQTREWFQAFVENGAMRFKSLGPLAKVDGKSWREIIDGMTFDPVKKVLDNNLLTATTRFSTVLRTAESRTASRGWADSLREDIDHVLAEARN